MLTDAQLKIIRRLKSGRVQEGIPITDNHKKVVGSFHPVNPQMANDSVVISALTKWRALNMNCFFTQFVATDERTRKWLHDVVLPDDSKLLFIMHDVSNKPIGNFGVKAITEKEAELDNLIRGESGGGPLFIYFAEISLLRWLYSELKIETVNLQALSTNLRVIEFHRSVGFKPTGTSPLKLITDKDGSHYVPAKTREMGDGNVDLLEMKMTRNEFFSISFE